MTYHLTKLTSFYFHSIDENLDLSQFTEVSSSIAARYTLVAVIVLDRNRNYYMPHYGSKTKKAQKRSNHYVCYARNVNGVFYRLDDLSTESTPPVVTIQELQNCLAVGLCYVLDSVRLI